MTADHDRAGDEALERIDALEARFTLVEQQLGEILEKVTLACEAAGITRQAAPPPARHRKGHLRVVKGLIAGGLGGFALKKLLPAALVTGAAASAIALLPPVISREPPRAAAAARVPATVMDPAPHVAQAPVAGTRHRHQRAAVSAAASQPSAAVSQAAPSPAPSPSGTSAGASVKVTIRLPVKLHLPVKDPACVGLLVLPPVCVGL